MGHDRILPVVKRILELPNLRELYPRMTPKNVGYLRPPSRWTSGQIDGPHRPDLRRPRPKYFKNHRSRTPKNNLN